MTRLSFIVIAFFLVLAACTAKLQQHSNNNTSINPTTVDKGLQGGAAKRDSVRLEDLIYPRLTTRSEYSRSYYFDTSKSNKVLTFEPEHFFENYRTLFSIPESNTLKYLQTRKISNGIQANYTGYYKGIKANVGANINMSNDGSIISLSYTLFNPSENFDVTPAITEREAFQIALKAMPANNFIWQEPWRSMNIEHNKRDNPNSKGIGFSEPVGQLAITQQYYETDKMTPYLVYQFSIPLADRGARMTHTWHVEISAKDGKVISVKDTREHCNDPCVFGAAPANYTTYNLPTIYNYGDQSLALNTCTNNNGCTFVRHKLNSSLHAQYLFEPTVYGATYSGIFETTKLHGSCTPDVLNVAVTPNTPPTTATATITYNGNAETIANLAVGDIHPHTLPNCTQTMYIAVGHTDGPLVTNVTTIPLEESSLSANAGEQYCNIASDITFLLPAIGSYAIKVQPSAAYDTYGDVISGFVENIGVTHKKYSLLKLINIQGNLPIRNGNYAILIKDNNTNKTTALNVTINEGGQNCYLQKQANTALWAVNSAKTFFGQTQNTIQLADGVADAIIDFPAQMPMFNT